MYSQLCSTPLCVSVCVGVYNIFIMHSSVGGYLGCFHFMAPVDKLSVKMDKRVSL